MKRVSNNEFDRMVDEITKQVVSRLNSTPSGEHIHAPGEVCNCTDGRCVRDCADRVKQVVANGAGRITSGLGYIPRDLSVARLIDHTLLKPDASAAEIAQLCREAREYHFASVCVNSAYVPLCADLLKGSDVAVCTVVGFPLGASPPEVKAYEAQLGDPERRNRNRHGDEYRRAEKPGCQGTVQRHLDSGKNLPRA